MHLRGACSYRPVRQAHTHVQRVGLVLPRSPVLFLRVAALCARCALLLAAVGLVGRCWVDVVSLVARPSSGVQAPAVGHLLALGTVLAYFAWRVVGNSKEARYRSQREELLRRAAHAAGQ
jgi:hypothetical protein